MQLRERHLTSALLGRQLSGGPVHRRPFVGEFCCEDGTVINNPGLTGTPAFAAEYSKVYNDCKLLAIADEEGYVSVVDTSCLLPTEMADEWGPNKPRAQWMAHRNAVFDIAWCNDDARMLTASGDQTVALWDTGHADLLASFRGHTGSVKTVSALPAQQEVFATGARDGALMVWDARGPGARTDDATGELYHAPVITVQDAHAPSGKQKRRRTPLQGRTRPSVTSLTFLQGDGNLLATGGVDGVVKFWDLRRASDPTAEAAPALALERLCDAGVPPISQKLHGITSLALHPQGSQLLVSLTGGHHFLYDPLRPQIGPTRWFGGHTVASFYVKAAWSPDGSHIISGSTDRNVYVWEVDAPDGASPYVLPGHQGEVTAVAWCPSDFFQIATTADDATLKVWRIQRRQPEEQADDGAARHPWVYPWQQHEQVAAAAAAAAAYGGLGEASGSATPLPSGFASASATPGGTTPWGPGSTQGTERAGGSSAAMLAELRGGGAAPGAEPLAQQQDAENLHSNLRSAVQQQQQGAAGVAAEQQQQQQQPARSAVQAPASASGPRSVPWQTPFVGRPAATASPAGGGTAGHTGPAAGTSGRPTARRIADLLNAVPSTRRTVRQQSIASFLRSPALAGAAGQGSSCRGAASAEPTAAAAASSRDLPDVGGSVRRAGAAPVGAPDSARGGPSAKRTQESPLPGLGGSALPSPRSKRLRTTFDTVAGPRSAPAGAAMVAAAECGSSAGAPGGSGSAGSKQVVGVLAQHLEPSPEQAGMAAAAAAAARKQAATAGGIQRRQSNAENELDNLQLA